MDCGDNVVVINAEKVVLTGKKLSDKIHYWHTGYPGGITKINMKKVRQDNPERIIMNALKGMLQHNRLGNKLGNS